MNLFSLSAPKTLSELISLVYFNNLAILYKCMNLSLIGIKCFLYKSLLAPQTHKTDGFHGNHEFKLPKDQGPLRGDCDPGAGEEWGIVIPD